MHLHFPLKANETQWQRHVPQPPLTKKKALAERNCPKCCQASLHCLFICRTTQWINKDKSSIHGMALGASYEVIVLGFLMERPLTNASRIAPCSTNTCALLEEDSGLLGNPFLPQIHLSHTASPPHPPTVSLAQGERRRVGIRGMAGPISGAVMPTSGETLNSLYHTPTNISHHNRRCLGRFLNGIRWNGFRQ